MNKKIAILVTNGFEDSEVKEPYDRLRDVGYKVMIVGPVRDLEITGKKGELTLRPDISVDSVTPTDFDALVIPGGTSPDRLRLNPEAVEFTKQFMDSGKPVAAICHGPQLLISADRVRDRILTCGPSVSVDVKNAGGKYVDEPIVIDRNLITSRKPGDLPQFIDAIIASLEEQEEQLTA